MGIRITWEDSEKTIARFRIEAPWKMDDIYSATAAVKAERKVENLQHPIGVILDATGIDSLPSGIIQNTAPMIKAMQPDTRLIVVASPNRFHAAMHGIFSKLYTKYADVFMFATSVEEARRLIYERLKRAAQR